MPRFLLTLCLLAVATAASANGGATAAGEAAEGSLKRGKSTTVSATQDGDVAATAPTPSLPARSTPRTVSPRWHSLLPGMIR